MCVFQAAYLVGIADPASEPGRPGLVDQSQFARANQAIQMACSNLTNPSASQQQVRHPHITEESSCTSVGVVIAATAALNRILLSVLSVKTQATYFPVYSVSLSFTHLD